jgi:hypothetical protein
MYNYKIMYEYCYFGLMYMIAIVSISHCVASFVFNGPFLHK